MMYIFVPKSSLSMRLRRFSDLNTTGFRRFLPIDRYMDASPAVAFCRSSSRQGRVFGLSIKMHVRKRKACLYKVSAYLGRHVCSMCGLAGQGKTKVDGVADR